MNSYNSLEPQLFYYLVYQKQNYSTSYGLKVGRGGASSQFHHKTRNIMFNNLYCGTPGGEVYCISRGLDRETEGAWINVGDASSFLGCGMSQSPKGGCNGIYTPHTKELLFFKPFTPQASVHVIHVLFRCQYCTVPSGTWASRLRADTCFCLIKSLLPGDTVCPDGHPTGMVGVPGARPQGL